MVAKRLTVARIRALSEPGMYRADPTLYLRVGPSGAKSWIQRLTIDGRRRDVGLGGFPLVSLAEARETAFDNRRLARRGEDPLAARARATVPTFEEAALRTLDANKAKWRNAKTASTWLSRLEMYVFPAVGTLRVDRLTTADVLRVLSPMWTAKPEVARKTRQYMRATFAWCQAHGYVDANPAGEAIDGALPRMPAVAKHFRAMPYRDVPAALVTVDATGASVAAKAAFRFLVLTAARSGEVREARWSEIDLDVREWRIPAERMKQGVEHRVPLADQIVPVIEGVLPLRDAGGLVFPSPMRRGRPLSDMSLTKLLRDAGLADRATVHGMRSAFRDWAGEQTRTEYTVMEAALAHSVGSAVERSYARSDLFDKRRLLMQRWADFCTSEHAKVVRLRG